MSLASVLLNTFRVSYCRYVLPTVCNAAFNVYRASSTVLPPRTSVQRNSEKIEVIDINDESLGFISRSSARRIAEERHLKLVEIISNGAKTEYKLMNGKQLMLEQKAIRSIKKSNKPKEVKVLRLASNIAVNDLNIKSRNLLEWLGKGNPVKISIKRKRSEKPELAEKTLLYITQKTEALATISKSKASDFELSFTLKPIANEELNPIETKENITLNVVNRKHPKRF